MNSEELDLLRHSIALSVPSHGDVGCTALDDFNDSAQTPASIRLAIEQLGETLNRHGPGIPKPVVTQAVRIISTLSAHLRRSS